MFFDYPFCTLDEQYRPYHFLLGSEYMKGVLLMLPEVYLQ